MKANVVHLHIRIMRFAFVSHLRTDVDAAKSAHRLVSEGQLYTYRENSMKYEKQKVCNSVLRNTFFAFRIIFFVFCTILH